MASDLHGWAETTVMAAREDDPGVPFNPNHGDICPACGGELKEGERVLRVIEETYGDEWLHESHVWKENSDGE